MSHTTIDAKTRQPAGLKAVEVRPAGVQALRELRQENEQLRAQLALLASVRPLPPEQLGGLIPQHSFDPCCGICVGSGHASADEPHLPMGVPQM